MTTQLEQPHRVGLSKSKITAFLQCRKRLWLAVFSPEMASPLSMAAEASIGAGEDIGNVAREIYGPGELLFDAAQMNYSEALQRSAAALSRVGETFFEAAFQANDVLVLPDVIQITPAGVHLIEVKSSLEVKDHQRADAAIQASVMRSAGVPLSSVRLAHVNKDFRYAGNADYSDLLKEVDISAEVFAREGEAATWIQGARSVLEGPIPDVQVGPQCDTPNECPFKAHCAGPEPKYPLKTIRAIPARQRKELAALGYADVTDIPDSFAATQSWAEDYRAVVSGTPIIRPAAATELTSLGYPRFYLDFETISFAVPRWPGTNPYQHLPFQWSIHVETSPGALEHFEFLDTTGECPARRCIEAMLARLGDAGRVLVYSGYEKNILNSMGRMYPDLEGPLKGIVARLLDLLPIARAAYFHRDLKGSWSIKKVLPTIEGAPSYDALGVRDGTQAQQAYLETIDPGTPAGRRSDLEGSMKAYCKLDTEAMVAVATFLTKQCSSR